jgi:lipopolysaccharide export LptBFGC system permease protein LptF
MVAYSLVVALLTVIAAYWLVPKIQSWAQREVARAKNDPDTQDIIQENKPD